MVSYSKDGGRNWSNWKYRSLGEIGEYTKRVKVGPVGQALDFRLRIRVTDPIKAHLLAVSANVEIKE